MKTLHTKVRLGGALLLALCGSVAHAQGILTVTPGRSTGTTVGTGSIGYTGDNAAAVSATLANPAAVAYDAAGNLYIADANNHVVRRVSPAGTIITVAGTGTAGFGGDGAAATAAFLDTPTGVAVDSTGNLYIADSHNHRIRKISGGTITTVAGTGSAGFSGDAGLATAAQLSLPSSVAVDASGNLYIADTNNQRIRKLTGTTISTIAGTGEQSYTGDGGAASSATLDSPTGVAVDGSGNVYIADRHNQRVRMISAAGTITTLAGSGTPTFAGSFAGDGAAAASSSLAKPTGVSVDTAGNVYVADTNNQRIRQVGNGSIASIAGAGSQGFGGDSGASTSAILNSPRAVVPDSSGNISVADTQNTRVRSGLLPTLTFASQLVGTAGTAQTVTLANTGTSALTISGLTFAGSFTTAAGGTCGATPLTLAAGSNCTQNIGFFPTATGTSAGSVTFNGTGVVPQKVLLSGSATQGNTTTTIATSATLPFVNQSITYTATVKPTGAGTPTGTVNFYANGSLIGSGSVSGAGIATTTTTFAVSGTYAITAVYGGDPSFGGSSSAALTQLVGDFNFNIGGTNCSSQTVEPGRAAVFTCTIAPLNGPFTFPVTLSATGLPTGATGAFAPGTLTLGSSPVTFTFTVQTPANSGALRFQHVQHFGETAIAFAVLMLPFVGRRRRVRPLLVVVFGVLSVGAMAGLTGCGSSSGFFGQPQQTYGIQIIGTAAGQNGATLQHVATVTLTVQ